MEPIGPKIAEGRDSEIFEHGAGRVLRVARDGRSLDADAEVMRYVRARGYPCPEVHDAGDGCLMMDRLEGPTMMEVGGRPPFPLRRCGHQLADLHHRLHQIEAPPWIRGSPLAGDRVVHRDLHPLNVMMTPDGPMVIDWAIASAGDPAFDVADTWVLFACATPPMKGIDRWMVPIGRRLLLRAFLSRVDRASARRAIPAAVDHRLTDENMSPDERPACESLLPGQRTAEPRERTLDAVRDRPIQVGPAVGVLGSRALFAATHFQVVQFIGLFVAGAVRAILAQRSGRLGPAVVSHMAFNLTTVALLYLA